MGGLVDVAVASVLLVAACALVGTAVRLLGRGRLVVPPSTGVTCGLGMAVVAVVVATTYRLLGTVRAPVVGLLAGSVVVIVVELVRRAASYRRGSRARWSEVLTGLGGRTELVALGLVVLVLLPVVFLGTTYWTLGYNDFHRYVASVLHWTSADSGRVFADVQSGPYLTQQLERADSEKPMATALLAFAADSTLLPSYRVLTPLTVALLLVTVASLLHLLVRRWSVPLLAASCGVAATTLSVLPMVRVLAAQPGQAAAAAALALGLLLVAGLGASRWLGQALFLGLVLAWATGSNPSLVAGFAPVWAATAWWVARRSGADARRAVLALACAAAAALVLVAVFLPWFAVSLRIQAGGAEGNRASLAWPLALVGLQPGNDPRVPAWVGALLWCVALVCVVVGVVRSRGAWRRHLPLAVVAVTAAGSAVVLALRYGSDNYVVQKWFSLLVAVVMPLVLSLALQRLLASARLTPLLRRATGPVLAAAALTASLLTATMLVNVGSRDLLALADDPRLAGLAALNVDVDDFFDESMLPLVVPAGRVVVTRTTYADAAPPDPGAPYLVLRRQAVRPGWTDVVALHGTYALARRDLRMPLPWSVPGDPASLRHLHGNWYPAPDGGLRCTSPSAWLVADLTPGTADQPLELRLTGLLGPDGRSSSLRVRVAGQALATIPLSATEPSDAVVVLPAGAAPGGLLEVELLTPRPVLADEGGYGFSVRSLALDVAGA